MIFFHGRVGVVGDTRRVPVSVYRVFRKCKPGTRLHSTPEAPDGKSRGGLESIKRPFNKVTHFEIYECTPCDTLTTSSLVRRKGRQGRGGGGEGSFCKLASSLNRLSPNGTIPRLRTRNFENLAVTRDVREAHTHHVGFIRDAISDDIRILYVTFISASISRNSLSSEEREWRKIDSSV